MEPFSSTIKTCFAYTSKHFIMECKSWNSQLQHSKFDELLTEKWKDAQKKGYFRYLLDKLQTKILPGTYHFVSQLNVKRAVQRRKPQEINCVSQPFNPSEFNFTKVSEQEVLFEIDKTDKSLSDNGLNHISENGFCDRCKPEDKQKHLMIINVSPLEFGNCLLVPNVNACLPQVLTVDSIAMGIEMILLSSTPAFRVGFNSLCANASVNHHHFHVYYLNHKLSVETISTKHLVNGCYEIVDYPAVGFAFQLTDTRVTIIANLVYKVTNYLQSNNYAHNLFLTRGTRFGTSNVTVYDTVRIYVWARKPSYGVKDDTAFNVACCELAGHLPIKNTEAFELITEEEAAAELSNSCCATFSQVCPAVVDLLSE